MVYCGATLRVIAEPAYAGVYVFEQRHVRIASKAARPTSEHGARPTRARWEQPAASNRPRGAEAAQKGFGLRADGSAARGSDSDKEGDSDSEDEVERAGGGPGPEPTARSKHGAEAECSLSD